MKTMTEEALRMTFRSDHRPILFTFPTYDDKKEEQRLVSEPYQGGKWKYREDKVEEVNDEISKKWAELAYFSEDSLDARLKHMLMTMVSSFTKVINEVHLNSKMKLEILTIKSNI